MSNNIDEFNAINGGISNRIENLVRKLIQNDVEDPCGLLRREMIDEQDIKKKNDLFFLLDGLEQLNQTALSAALRAAQADCRRVELDKKSLDTAEEALSNAEDELQPFISKLRLQLEYWGQWAEDHYCERDLPFIKSPLQTYRSNWASLEDESWGSSGNNEHEERQIQDILKYVKDQYIKNQLPTERSAADLFNLANAVRSVRRDITSQLVTKRDEAKKKLYKAEDELSTSIRVIEEQLLHLSDAAKWALFRLYCSPQAS